jgi:hypothetical protein
MNRLFTFKVCQILLAFFLASVFVGCQNTNHPCQAAELLPPEITSGPAEGEIIATLRPSYAWRAANDCAVQGYQLEIGNQQQAIISNTATTSWAMNADLQEATRYSWKVAAVAPDGTVGPFSRSTTFFTGPTCSANQMMEISLDSPSSGQVVGQGSPELKWSYASYQQSSVCMPEGHRFVVQNQATGQVVLQGDGGPHTSFSTPIQYLEDCQRYQWWVIPTMNGQPANSYGSKKASFSTDFGGLCASCDSLNLQAPVPLTPPDGAIWTQASPVITWEYDQPYCLNAFEFRAEISPDPAFTPPVTNTQFPAHEFSMMFDPAAYLLEDCTTYYWRVFALQSDAGGSQVSQVSPTFSFITDFTGNCQDDVLGEKPGGKVARDSVCRGGPGTAYPIRLYLSGETQVDFLGRSEDSSWLVIRRPDGYGECWINASLLETTIQSIAGLPVKEAPPLPTPTNISIASPGADATAAPPVACSTYGTKLSCELAGCNWLSGTSIDSGECVNP